MPQYEAWEREYRSPTLITLSETPQNDFKRFVAYLRKKAGISLEGARVLDLGSGTGKNALFLAQRGARVTGFDISNTAIAIAKKSAADAGLAIDYRKRDIGAPYDLADESYDVVLDVIASNSLSEKERATYLSEAHRVLKPAGWLFVRALAKEGDKNAQALLKKHSGVEPDTYTIPELSLTERVFTEKDFRAEYGAYFDIRELTKKYAYARMGDRLYKRAYLLAYMTKR